MKNKRIADMDPDEAREYRQANYQLPSMDKTRRRVDAVGKFGNMTLVQLINARLKTSDRVEMEIISGMVKRKKGGLNE